MAWDRLGRDREPAFTYWPTGSDRPELGENTAALVKTDGVHDPESEELKRMSAVLAIELADAEVDVVDVVDVAEFELDMRVVESLTKLVITMCDTSGGCGGSPSACLPRHPHASPVDQSERYALARARDGPQRVVAAARCPRARLGGGVRRRGHFPRRRPRPSGAPIAAVSRPPDGPCPVR